MKGTFVPRHPALRTDHSEFSGPSTADRSTSYNFSLTWSERTFDGPVQLWKATSRHSLKEYKGPHTVQLVPCLAAAGQVYQSPPEDFCSPADPLRFQVSVSASQASVPVPAVYSMNTEFQLLSDRDHFLSDPKDLSYALGDDDERSVFFRGETLFGRVVSSPLEDLNVGLRIDQVYLCAGKRGFAPTFDPTGKELGHGPTFGCVQPSPNLEHRFLLLDRHSPDQVHGSVGGVSFQAELADEDSMTRRLMDFPGVDGFSLKVDPLYEAASGTEWYLQVLYSITPLNHRRTRFNRDASSSEDYGTATNMRAFSTSEAVGGTGGHQGPSLSAATNIVLSVTLTIVGAAAAVFWRRRNFKYRSSMSHAKADRSQYVLPETSTWTHAARVTRLSWTPAVSSSCLDATEV